MIAWPWVGHRLLRYVALPFIFALLAACAGITTGWHWVKVEKPFTPLIGITPVWKSSLGAAGFTQSMRVVAETVFIAGVEGLVVAIDGKSGAELWRAGQGVADAPTPLDDSDPVSAAAR